MPGVDEREVYNALLRLKGNTSVRIGEAQIELALDPVDVHTMGRPDAVIWLEVSLSFFAQDLRLRIPIPVEAEKCGIAGAMEDLEAFVDRGQYIPEIPMLVIAEAGFDYREEQRDVPVRFKVTQIPLRFIRR